VDGGAHARAARGTLSPVTPLLAARAAAQGGPFTWGDASDCGVRPRDISRAVAREEWLVLYPGVFVEAELWARLDARSRHLGLVRARLLRKSKAWMAGRRSAAVVHDLPLIGHAPDVPQLLRGYEGKRPKARSRHERISTLYDGDADEVDGIPTSSLSRTVCDISRAEEFRNGVVVADGALRAGLDQEVLLASARRFADWPEGAAALRVARFATGLAESALESISRVAIVQSSLPDPEQQVEVYVGRELVARVDFLIRAANLVGQADGDVKYDSKTDVLADKRQDERLQDLGFEVVRWGWEFPWRKRAELEARIRRGMERGARQTLDPRVRLVPISLARSIELARRYRDAA
jgi:very-short-patch-repair endonuclease